MLKAYPSNFYLLVRSISLVNIASINIAVKNKLKDGINIGYQSFWNKSYRSEFPLTLKAKLIPSNNEPNIKI